MFKKFGKFVCFVKLVNWMVLLSAGKAIYLVFLYEGFPWKKLYLFNPSIKRKWRKSKKYSNIFYQKQRTNDDKLKSIKLMLILKSGNVLN